MIICLVSPIPPPYGGISHWTLLMHRYAELSCNDIQLVQVDTAPRWHAFHDTSLSKRFVGGIFQLIKEIFVLIKYLLFRKPDVIHITSSGGLAIVRELVIMSLGRLFQIPIVYHIHYGRIFSIAIENAFEWHFAKIVLRMSTKVITITSQTLETIKKYLPGVDVVYIPNPIDCSILLSDGEIKFGKRRVLFLGWVIPSKGILELVQAWSELNPENWELIIVGPGPEEYQKSLRNIYNPINLSFLGELEHTKAMEVMAHCDLFVLPSYTEGFPYVILEAMAYKKAIIATSVGAIPEILSGNCGLLVNQKDVNQLKTGLSTLMQNDELRKELGKNAFEKVQRDYCIDGIFSQYINIWKFLASSKLNP